MKNKQTSDNFKSLMLQKDNTAGICVEICHKNKIITFENEGTDKVVVQFNEWNCIRNFINNEVSK